MLHVRVVSPVALTEQLTGRLATAPGVQNMVVRAGAAGRPIGDAVEFDVRSRISSTQALELGRSLGLAAATAAQRRAAGHGRRGRPRHPARDLAQALAFDHLQRVMTSARDAPTMAW